MEQKAGAGGGAVRGKGTPAPCIFSYLEKLSTSHPIIFYVLPAGVSPLFPSINGRVPMCTCDPCFSQTSASTNSARAKLPRGLLAIDLVVPPPGFHIRVSWAGPTLPLLRAPR